MVLSVKTDCLQISKIDFHNKEFNLDAGSGGCDAYNVKCECHCYE